LSGAYIPLQQNIPTAESPHVNVKGKGIYPSALFWFQRTEILTQMNLDDYKKSKDRFNPKVHFDPGIRQWYQD
jgi:hypothetical protein